mmetsp:Transcript_34502/g.94989  ORF Transcript_34502/g.94989 Transcript_34502/m.94989 type:complete len:278 (-) Transcript_34502:26-859(-)
MAAVPSRHQAHVLSNARRPHRPALPHEAEKHGETLLIARGRVHVQKHGEGERVGQHRLNMVPLDLPAAGLRGGVLGLDLPGEGRELRFWTQVGADPASPLPHHVRVHDDGQTDQVGVEGAPASRHREAANPHSGSQGDGVIFPSPRHHDDAARCATLAHWRVVLADPRPFSSPPAAGVVITRTCVSSRQRRAHVAAVPAPVPCRLARRRRRATRRILRQGGRGRRSRVHRRRRRKWHRMPPAEGRAPVPARSECYAERGDAEREGLGFHMAGRRWPH